MSRLELFLFDDLLCTISSEGTHLLVVFHLPFLLNYVFLANLFVFFLFS